VLFRSGTVYTAALTPDAQPLGAALSAFSLQPSAFLIGPEGDLTPAEYESAFAAGARPVSFGPQVLRVETAAIFAVCAAQAFAQR
jgi:16S rRNA (uracil1498-N3)-methyltransferase